MRTLTITAAAVLLLSSVAYAQQQQQIETRTEARPEQKKQATPPLKLSKQEEKRAMELLEGAEAAAGGLQPASRVLAFVELARAYQMNDRDKAADLLEQAYTATRDLQIHTPNEQMNRQIQQRLQQRVLRALVALAPARVDKMIDELPVENRANVINAMLGYYRDNHDLARPIDLVTRISDEAEMPYGTTTRIMDLLGPDQQDQLRQLFTASLASYQNHKHGNELSTEDFASMIPKFYGKVPDDLIRQAIDEVLSQAKAAAENAKQGDSPTIGMSSAQGAVQFNSVYDYHLFQLLPVLRKLDPEKAEKLLQQSRDVQTFLSKYPQGMSSLNPPSKPGSAAGGGTMMMRTVDNSGSNGGSVRPPGGSPVPQMAAPPSMGEAQRSEQIVDDSASHPNDALAAAITLSPGLRVQTYVGIARQNVKKDTSIAKSALGKALDSFTDVPPPQQMMSIGDIASLYQQLGETDSAKKAIEKGMDIAAKLYKTDTNADDPNTAPKAYWPSTNAWRTMLDRAAAISPEWAVSLLKDIPDDDIRNYDQIAIAEGMLGVPRGVLEVMTITKDNVNMMVSGPDNRE